MMKEVETGMRERENFQSRLGFILVSAGCAIGIGNVWKFPYVTGANGGGIFVLFYLLFLAVLGVPVLSMELAVGRASRRSAVEGYRKLEKPGSKWHIHGWFCFGGNALLMMYYTTVAGWMLAFFVKYVIGTFKGMETEELDQVFFNMLANPGEMTIFMALVVIVGFLVCLGGVKNGLEKVTKVMMICLLVLITVLAVHSLLLPGAGKGVSFYLLPNMDAVKETGLKNVIVAAMNQAFFTLSLGIGSMEIFGSYMSKDKTLVSESVTVCALDTFVAVMAGLIIFPACFSYKVAPDAGPSLIFITLPKVFANMPLGRLWGALFFLFMTFASFSTVTAVFENLIAIGMDTFGWSRAQAVAVNCVVILAASVPCVLGYNILSNVHLIGGRDILDSEDFIVSNLLLPGGALIYLLFCVTKWGWGFDKYLAECNTGEGIRMPAGLKYFFRFAVPLLILVILVEGLI